MAKFQYRMQNILEIKEKLETQAKTDFATASHKLRTEEEKLEEIYNYIDKYKESIRQINSSRLDLLQLKACNNAIKIKRFDAKNQKTNIKLAQKDLDIARVKLNKVMAERKTHEILKEKAFDEFKKEQENNEHKEVDELISFQYSKLD